MTSKRLLPIIVSSTIVLVFTLRAIVPPEYDIPNWMTMTVELGIGIFIATLIFILQESTGKSLREFNEEQKRLRTSIRLRSLELIERYLSMAYDSMDYDRKMIENEVRPSLEHVEYLLRTPFNQPPRIEAHIIEQLQKESAFVRSYEFRTELVDNLKSIIEKIQIMYGFSGVLPPDKKVKNWLTSCDIAFSQIERTKALIREIRKAENNN
jgi:hypothetical protein